MRNNSASQFVPILVVVVEDFHFRDFLFARKKKAAEIRWENEVFHSSAYFLYRKQWKH